MDKQFPDGKMNDFDEGALEIGITVSKGVIIIDFAKPVIWAGLPPDMAVELGLTLIKRAKEVGLKKPVTVEF